MSFAAALRMSLHVFCSPNKSFYFLLSGYGVGGVILSVAVCVFFSFVLIRRAFLKGWLITPATSRLQCDTSGGCLWTPFNLRCVSFTRRKKKITVLVTGTWSIISSVSVHSVLMKEKTSTDHHKSSFSSINRRKTTVSGLVDWFSSVRVTHCLFLV